MKGEIMLRKMRKGFTLLEMTIVVLIISVLFLPENPENRQQQRL